MARMVIDQAQSFSQVFLTSCAPKLAFKDGVQTGEQESTRDGVLKWTLQATVLDRETGRGDLVKFTVVNPKDPAEGMAPGTLIHFEALTVGTLSNGGAYFSAAGVKPAAAGPGRRQNSEQAA